MKYNFVRYDWEKHRRDNGNKLKTGQVIKLRDDGKSFSEIGRILNFSKQRAHQIYKHENT